MKVPRALGMVCGLIALALGLVSAGAQGWQIGYAEAWQWTFSLLMVAVGATLTWRRPENRVGVLVAAIPLLFSLMGAGQSLSAVALDGGRTTESVAWGQVEGVAFTLLIVALLTLLPLWFPTGRAMSPRWAILGRIGIALAIFGSLVTVFAGEACVYDSADECHELAVPWGFLPGELYDLIWLALLVMGVPAIFGLFVRYRRAGSIERHQLRWFFLAFMLFGVVLAAALALSTSVSFNVDLVIWTAAALIPVSIGVAVLRYRLYEIDRILSRTVSYAVVVAVLAGVVLALAAIVGAQFESPLIVAATTLGVAAVFNPLRRRVQRWVDHRFNRSRYDAEVVMDEFARSLRDEVDGELVVHGWVGVVSETMQPSSVGVWVRS